MQALKDGKDAPDILRLNTHTIVPYYKPPGVLLALGADVDGRRRRGAKFEGVAQEVLEQLQQLVGVR